MKRASRRPHAPAGRMAETIHTPAEKRSAILT